MSTDTLIRQARRLAADLKEVPARNRIMEEFGISGPRASALRDELIREETRAQLATARQAPRRARLRTSGAHLATVVSRLKRVGTKPPRAVEPVAAVEEAAVQVTMPDAHPVAVEVPVYEGEHRPIRKPARGWPVLLLSLPAFVAIWSGWVELGEMSGFGVVQPLPGIWDGLAINSAITLPIGMETLAAYALRVWLTPDLPRGARWFAGGLAIGALVLGAGGQVAYHQMAAAGWTTAPWQITTVVSCLPVLVLGMGATLFHLVRQEER